MPSLDFSKVPVTKENGTPEITTEVYDPKPFKELLSQHKRRIDLVRKQAHSIRLIKDDDGATNAIDLAGNIKKALDMIDDQFKVATDPHSLYVKEVQKIRDFWKKPLTKAYKHITGLLGSYEQQKEVTRLAQEKIAKQEAEALQQRIQDKADKAGVEAPKIEIPVTTQKETMRGEKGTLVTKKRWTWETLEENKVPRKYLTIDKKAVTAAVRAGAREIAGIRIFETYDAGIRTK